MSRTFVFFVIVGWLGSGIAEAQTIYWTDIGSRKIQRLDLEQWSVQDLVTEGVFQPSAIALDEIRGKIYWTETSPADFQIWEADLDGRDVRFLIEGLSNPSGIAVDPQGAKIYWTDIGSRKIQRANLDGTGREDLVSAGLEQPVDLALDITHGKLYWTEASPGDYVVFRANLDGSEVQGIVEATGSPGSGIAVDPVGAKMYWTEWSPGKIRRANLDGTAPEDLVTVSVQEPVRITLDPLSDKMYWTEGSPADFMVSRANLDGSGIEFLVDSLLSPSGIAVLPRAAPVRVRPTTWTQLKQRFEGDSNNRGERP
ncbi:MAG TPA: hypothetical protein VFP10_09620 [Candidatus Eisenbacteria bacterium]|nr:hypothetical protein [Candidatus Eisenbacteria bacterium]